MIKIIYCITRKQGMTVEEFYVVADSIPEFRGIGRYPWGLHLDVRNAILSRWCG